jgi:hypothetical protein
MSDLIPEVGGGGRRAAVSKVEHPELWRAAARCLPILGNDGTTVSAVHPDIHHVFSRPSF